MFFLPEPPRLSFITQATKRCLPFRFICEDTAAIERVAELGLANALKLGAPCRFNFWVGHQRPFSKDGSFATLAAMRRASSLVRVQQHLLSRSISISQPSAYSHQSATWQRCSYRRFAASTARSTLFSRRITILCLRHCVHESMPSRFLKKITRYRLMNQRYRKLCRP